MQYGREYLNQLCRLFIELETAKDIANLNLYVFFCSFLFLRVLNVYRYRSLSDIWRCIFYLNDAFLVETLISAVSTHHSFVNALHFHKWLLMLYAGGSLLAHCGLDGGRQSSGSAGRV